MSLKRTIYFNEALHRYTDEDKNVYTSVTTLIGQYHPKFNEDYWAKKKAEEAGITVQQMKANWKEIRDYSCDRGNKTHKELEDSINASNGKANFEFDRTKEFLLSTHIPINKVNLHILANSPLAQKYPIIYSYLRQHIEMGWTLYAEKRIYWHPYLIAGTIDCLLIKEKQFIIVDWKTNKEQLKFISGYYKKVNGVKTNEWINKKEYFFYPISHLEHCKGEIYTMQLSLYAHLLELWGYECINLCLFHILNDIPQPFKILTYREQEAKNLCTHFKNGLIMNSSININTKQGTKFGIS